MATHVEVEQLLAKLRRRTFVASLEVHDADRAHPRLVHRAFQEDLHLIQRHLGELFRQREDIAHPSADGHVEIGGVFDPGFRERRAFLTCSGSPNGSNRWMNRLASSWVGAVRVTVQRRVSQAAGRNALIGAPVLAGSTS